jgi:putative Holliday junction resolvase
VSGFRAGARLGVDVGSVRVGVASCDSAGVLASPVETVPRDPRGDADLRRIADLAAEFGVIEIVVGLPLSLSGKSGPAAATASDYAARLAAIVAPTPVRLVDERLSTVSAHGNLASAGLGSRARRAVVDQAAAVIILQSALDTERATGRPPGQLTEAEGRSS